MKDKYDNKMIKSNSYNPQRDHHNIIGFYGEPKAPAYLAKAISFYSKLFLFPFSVKWSENQRQYKVVPFNSLQKACFLLFVFGNTISFLFWVTKSIQELEEISKSGEVITAGILVLFCLLLTWLSVTTVIVIIWIQQNELCQFLKVLEDSLDVLHLPSAMVRYEVWLCPVLFYFASSITNLYSQTGQITVSHGAQMMTDGILCIFKRFGILAERKIGVRDQGWVYTGMVKCLQGFFKLIIFHGGCFCSMPHTLLLSLSLGLRQIGKEVEKTLESETVLVYEGIRIYEKMKRISSSANTVFGTVMFTHYICNLTYAIQTPFLFSEVGQMVEDVNYLLWLIVSALIWWIGSEFHRLIQESFRNWIQFNLNREMSLDDRLKLSILSNSIDKDNLGLYCRYFMVSHRFLTTTCGAVITYGIIILEVKM